MPTIAPELDPFPPVQTDSDTDTDADDVSDDEDLFPDDVFPELTTTTTTQVATSATSATSPTQFNVKADLSALYSFVKIWDSFFS